MWIDFNQLPDHARLWVYQANRLLTNTEVLTIEQAMKPNLNSWAAHGQPLLASAAVIDNRFLLIAVDENQSLPSGCSIDASVRFVQGIGQQLNADFMDRAVAYRTADGRVQTLPLPAIKPAVADGQLTPDTLVFNTLVATKAELQANWQVRAGETWLKRYFKAVIA